MDHVDDIDRDDLTTSDDQDDIESAKKSLGKECKTRRKIEDILELRQLRSEFGMLSEDFDLGFEEAYS